jgi:hypothetical protein
MPPRKTHPECRRAPGGVSLRAPNGQGMGAAPGTAATNRARSNQDNAAKRMAAVVNLETVMEGRAIAVQVQRP